MVRCRCESGVEKTRFSARKLEVGLADGAQTALGTGWTSASRTHLLHPVGHTLGESVHRRIAHGRQEGVAVDEMAVGGIRDNTNLAGDLAEDHRVGSARARELEASRDECSTDGSARPRSATPRRGCCMTAGRRIT
jgi:hypothetical protein